MSVKTTFKFTFATPHAYSRLVLGGLFTMLFFTVYFAFVTVGYLMRMLCNALEGRNTQLPRWQGYNQLFNEGVMPIIIAMAYFSPVFLLLIVGELFPLFAPMPDWMATAGLVVRGVLALAASFVLPLALIHFSVKGRLQAAFDLNAFFTFIEQNFTRYVTAWLLSVLFFAAALVVGLAAVVVGVFFTSFIASVMVLNLFAHIYRESEPFVDDFEGKQRASIVLPPRLH